MILSQELEESGESLTHLNKQSLTICSPDQLILMDDPAFLPETALPALDFDFSNLEIGLPGSSIRSSQSMMSIHGRNRTNSTPHGDGALQLPSSSTHVGHYQLPFDDPFVGPSSQRAFGSTGQGLFDDEGEYFQDDMIFEFDANGEMRDIDASEREARRAGLVHPATPLGGDSAAGGRMRKDHEDAATGHIIPVFDPEGDFDVANFYDDGAVLPGAEPFPMMSGALGGNDKPQPLLVSEDRVYQASSEVMSSTTASAHLKSRKSKSRKAVLGVDRTVELHNSDLLKWQTEYKSSMAAATLLVLQRKAIAQAKKNAFFFVSGIGLNGVGKGVGSSKIPSPLEMFSGNALLSKITGQSVPSAVSKSKKAKRSLDIDVAQQVTPKRARLGNFEGELGRGDFEDDQGMMMEDASMGMEVGRDAPSALPDYPSSALMPWNASSSLNSYQRGASSSLHGRGLGSAGRRPPSASPLVGRGSVLPGPLELLSQQDGEVLYGRDDHSSSQGGPARNPSQAEFELFGPAAQVDTQTAGDSQWVRDALNHEADNFFDFVVNTISEKIGHEFGENGQCVACRNMFVTFEELFEPARNSTVVAAQAFYHVLGLATKGRVWIEQDVGEEPFGEIRVGVVG